MKKATHKRGADGLSKVSETSSFQEVVKELSSTPDTEKWLKAVVLFKQQPYGEEDLAYAPGQLVQCTFPHDDPGDVPEWSRSTPWLTVSIRPGYKTDQKTGKRVCVGYPFGTVPRLLMFYIMTEVEHKKNRSDLTLKDNPENYSSRILTQVLMNLTVQ
jgi:hypothetical protein